VVQQFVLESLLAPFVLAQHDEEHVLVHTELLAQVGEHLLDSRKHVIKVETQTLGGCLQLLEIFLLVHKNNTNLVIPQSADMNPLLHCSIFLALERKRTVGF
jgi:hypothetical protein